MPKASAACASGILLLVLLSTAKCQLDTSTGFISPPPGVPDYTPGWWNQAYKLTMRGVPFKGPRNWPYAPFDVYNTPDECTPVDADPAMSEFTNPVRPGRKAGSCAYRNTTDTTFDFWVKAAGAARMSGNCYCYALGLFRGGYCIPGSSNGAIDRFREKATCKTLNDGIIADGAVPVSRHEALSGQPSKGHYILLMARPDGCIPGHCYSSDFHAVRKDSTGTWSWKLPTLPASDKDLFGASITDPETAPLAGLYFPCGFFRVEPDKMTVYVSGGGKKGPLSDLSVMDLYKGVPGVTIDVTPVPYSSADDYITPKDQQILDEDAAWERKRGSKEYEDWKTKQMQALELIPSTGSTGSPGSTANSGNSDLAFTPAARGLRAAVGRRMLDNPPRLLVGGL